MSLQAASGSDLATRLVERLSSRTLTDPDFWDFNKNDRRSHGHALFPYPAMMVPQLQGALLDDLMAVDPTVEWCYDPFGGAGTVLTECMRRGLNFAGSDLNPLAALIMAVKAQPIRERTLRVALDRVLDHAAQSARQEPVEFSGRDKWFTPEVSAQLARLRAAIRAQPGRPTRRFLWVCLGATVRLVCNSRTSTFKLHAYPDSVLRTRKIDVCATFRSVTEAAAEQMGEQQTTLVENGHLLRGRYTGEVRIRHGDALGRGSWSTGTPPADVLMTSPPYGDNRTTVPYGQHSFLPLMWIDRADIPAAPGAESLVASPYRLDVASIGGRRVVGQESCIRDLSERSPLVAATAALLTGLSGTGLQRFVSFCADLDAAIKTIGTRLRPGAVQFWTLGNRRISGIVVPTGVIVSELSAARGIEELITLHRSFPRNAKRMACRNDSVPLMDTEQILVMKSPPDRAKATVAESRSGTFASD